VGDDRSHKRECAVVDDWIVGSLVCLFLCPKGGELVLDLSGFRDEIPGCRSQSIGGCREKLEKGAGLHCNTP
jgi:hypothetical protein